MKDKTIPKSSLETTYRPQSFDTKIYGLKSGTKNAIKMQKLVGGLEDSPHNRLLQYVSIKHKLQLEDEEGKNPKSAFYVQSFINID